MNAVGVRIGQIIVSDVSEARLRTAFPDCEIAAIGADLQITFKQTGTGQRSNLSLRRSGLRKPGSRVWASGGLWRLPCGLDSRPKSNTYPCRPSTDGRRYGTAA